MCWLNCFYETISSPSIPHSPPPISSHIRIVKNYLSGVGNFYSFLYLSHIYRTIHTETQGTYITHFATLFYVNRTVQNFSEFCFCLSIYQSRAYFRKYIYRPGTYIYIYTHFLRLSNII